jgi:myo-inositol-1(or 4)-monophosphatase
MVDMLSPQTAIEPQVLAAARDAAREAGRLALRWFRPGQGTAAKVSYKQGGSPVTAADLAVDAFLRERLGGAAPGYGWLSEETVDDSSRLERPVAWVVDPIDGTRAFARGDADWTVAVGLVAGGVPIAGFVYAPVSDEMFEALPGDVARRNGVPIAASGHAELAHARVAGPDALMEQLGAGSTPFHVAPRIHSLAFRMVRVADGTLDAGLAGSRAHDWDLAAAHAILTASGATLVGASGDVPTYNRSSTVHEPLAAAGERLARDLAARIATPARRR